MIVNIGGVEISTDEMHAVVDVCRACNAGLVPWDGVREWAKTITYDVSDMAKARQAEGTILGSAWNESFLSDGITWDDWSDAMGCRYLTEEQYAEVFQDRFGVSWYDS